MRQQLLYQDCEAIDSVHNFSFFSMWTSGNVVHRCLARDGRLSTDLHGHLSMANLFDCTTVDRDDLQSEYRPFGTVIHGHTTTESVFWNTYGTSVSPANIIESPQWGLGYVVGTSGPQDGVSLGTADNTAPEDFLEGEGLGAGLEPRSLYLDQLARRIGVGTLSGLQRTSAVGYTFPSSSGVTYELQSTAIDLRPRRELRATAWPYRLLVVERKIGCAHGSSPTTSLNLFLIRSQTPASRPAIDRLKRRPLASNDDLS